MEKRQTILRKAKEVGVGANSLGEAESLFIPREAASWGSWLLKTIGDKMEKTATHPLEEKGSSILTSQGPSAAILPLTCCFFSISRR